MPTKAINSGYYKDSQDDLADKLLQYHSCTNTELPYKTSDNPIKFTAYNSADPWTIPVPISDEYLVNSEIIQGIKEGSKPQFDEGYKDDTWYSNSYTVMGSDAGKRNEWTSKYRWLKLTSDGSLFDLGYGESIKPRSLINTGTFLASFRFTALSGSSKVPSRIMLVCQAAGGGGGGSNHHGFGTQTGNGVTGGSGGGSGATAVIILDTSKPWYISIGHAGWGGYGAKYTNNRGTLSAIDTYPSTDGADIVISDYIDPTAYNASDNTYAVIGGGKRGIAQDATAAPAPMKANLGGEGGTIEKQIVGSATLWVTTAKNGHYGGASGDFNYQRANTGFSVSAGNLLATNVSDDKTGYNIKAYTSHYGGSGGANKIVYSSTLATCGGGGGGAASCFGDGGAGGTYCYVDDNGTAYKNSGKVALGYGSGGGGAGGMSYISVPDVRVLTDYGVDGGNGAPGFVMFYGQSA